LNCRAGVVIAGCYQRSIQTRKEPYMNWTLRLRRTVLAIGLATFASFSYAADVTARIKGTVVDPSGAVVPNVSVTATNSATGVKFTTTSQSNGDYQFLQLPIGTYSITATSAGFKTFEATGIALSIDQQYVEPVRLELGNTSEKVEVTADAVQVNTSDMQLSNVVSAAQIVEYPLIGRSFTQLEQILPGVQASNDRFGNNYSVNGSQTQQSSYLINGADTNDFALNTIGIQPNPDALGEFNLITSSLNAEYSRNSGAIVSTAIKVGTNAFHGDAFEFYRDTFLNTPNFFQYSNTTQKKLTPKYHQNLFGGTLGGPILKDKLFFFGAYQGNRAKSPQTTGGSTVVLTNAQRGGDFTGAKYSKKIIPGTINIPGCVSGVDTFAACFAAHPILPTKAFNPIAAALIAKYVPVANSGTRYIFSPQITTVQDQGIGRIDFNPSTRDQIYFIGIYQHLPTVRTLPFTGSTLPGFGDQNTSEIRQFSFGYSRQITSTALNEFALHYTRFNFGSVLPQQVVLPSTAGFPINPQNTAGAGLPRINITGAFSLGFSSNGPQPRIDQNYQLDDNFSKVVGHHSLKFGYDGRRFNVDNNFSGNNNGTFGFSTSNPNSSGNALLDFVLGNPSTYNQGAGGRISAVALENYFYGQDTWKAMNSLTINYGVGYQIDTAIHNRQFGGKGINCFIPGQQSKVFPSAPLSLNFPGDPGCNDAQGATAPLNDVGPRIGFAYSPELGFLSGGQSHKLSIRGGYGIYYNRTEEEGSLQNLSQAPFGISSAGVADSVPGARPSFPNPYQDIQTGKTYKNPFPATFPKPGDPAAVFSQIPLYISQYAPRYRAPYSENFNLTVERELPGKIVATASYVGALGRHNQFTVEGNPITQAGHDACLADPACIANMDSQPTLYPSHTLFPQPLNPVTKSTHFHSNGVITTEGSSNFNALELSARKGQTHGLSFQISYTYGHSLDDSSSFEGAGFGGERGYNQFQKSLNYGNSDFDARHRLVIAPIYRVPYRTSGSPYSLLNLLGAGWEVSTISTFATGFPFDIAYNGIVSNSLYCGANDFYYTCPDVPNQVAPLQHLNPRNLANKGQYFEDGSSANGSVGFTDEVIGSFGNISRNKYHGPGILNTDAAISKNFQLGDSARSIQLRMEGYNVFNHTQFNNPNSNYSNVGTTFGVISTAAPGRQVQLVGKIYF